jgi:hypothetical protein
MDHTKTTVHYVHRILTPRETKERYGKNNYTYVVSSKIKPFNCSSHDLNRIIQLYYSNSSEYANQAEIYDFEIKEYPCDIFDPTIQMKFKMFAIRIDDTGSIMKPAEDTRIDDSGYEADSDKPPKLPAGSVNLIPRESSQDSDTDAWEIPVFKDTDGILEKMTRSEYDDMVKRGGSRYYGARIITCKYPPYKTRVEFENYGSYHTVVPESHIITPWKPAGRTNNEDNLMEELIKRDFVHHKKTHPDIKDEFGSLLSQINKMISFYKDKEKLEFNYGMKHLFEEPDSDDDSCIPPIYKDMRNTSYFDKDDDGESSVDHYHIGMFC